MGVTRCDQCIDLTFDTKHKHIDVMNEGKTAKGNAKACYDVAIYSVQSFSNGVHTWRFQMDKIATRIGVGIYANNTDRACYNQYFLFDNATSYGGLSGKFKEGDIITMTLNFANLTLSLEGPNVHSQVSIKPQTYYCCFELYAPGDQLSIIS